MYTFSPIKLTLPPWPLYRRKPLQWQKARKEDGEGDAATNSSSSGGGSGAASHKKKKKN